MVSALNALIPDLFQGVKGFDPKTQLDTDDLHFEDAQKRNQEVTRADAWGWITVILIVFFVFGTILSSVASWYYKKEAEKRLEERRARRSNKNKKPKDQVATSAVIAAEVDALLNSQAAVEASPSKEQSEPLQSKRKRKRGKKGSALERVVKSFSL